MALYSMVPVYIVYAEMLGILTHPSRIFASAGMSFVIAIVIIARRKGHKIFSRKDVHDPRSGFTLIELLVSISILGILAAIILPVVNGARSDAYFARAKAELKQVAISLERYALDYMNYPPDANRDIPNGLEQYLTTGNWPKAPWPGSVYDWDAWGPGSLAYPPHEQVYQISIRFCPVD
ncbi:MAG TPA: prepilin-type N-terminal cleavage/methylation domain-containing protein, partial [Candidatus Paceibacterota bacterium]|nr:prepilin-type N-terminal cleavage/methylation domain-containing protein [Candidatus Paceibacterota bacterium]